MLHPDAKGQRFLASSGEAMSFYDVAEFIKKERPQLSANVVQMKPTAAEFYPHISTNKAIETFGWQPRSKEEALLASVDSLYKV
jgi:nucleoside-diphosphate-sugar epimerase